MKRAYQWILLLIVIFTLSVGFAQEGGFDPVAWGSNPALALGALAGAVAWLRQTKWGSGIDGAFPVALVTAATGAIGGAVLQLFNVLTVPPFASFSTPWGGIGYGLVLAASAVTGVSLINYFGGKFRPTTINVAIDTDRTSLAISPSGANAMSQEENPIVRYVLDQLIALVGLNKLPAAIVAIAPLLASLAQSEAVLTEELRSKIQGDLLTLLRRAGLVGQDL